jgi:hypothetical protein
LKTYYHAGLCLETSTTKNPHLRDAWQNDPTQRHFNSKTAPPFERGSGFSSFTANPSPDAKLASEVTSEEISLLNSKMTPSERGRLLFKRQPSQKGTCYFPKGMCEQKCQLVGTFLLFKRP